VFFFSVGSYFALQWLANLLVAATALGHNCVQSATANKALHLLNLFAAHGLSVIGTNLLCHRYLVEKARVMTKLCGTSALTSHVLSFESAPLTTHPDSPHVSALHCFFNISIVYANDPSVKHLETLEGSLVWEGRSLFFVAVGVPVLVIYEPVGLAIAGLGILVVFMMVIYREIQSTPSTLKIPRIHSFKTPPSSLIKTPPPSFEPSSPHSPLPQDTPFSCVVILRPIFKILGEVGGVRSEGQNQFGEDQVADAPGGKSCCHFLDGSVHQFWVVCGAGRPRKTVLRQPLLARHGLWQ
jgi:hypothetical protein